MHSSLSCKCSQNKYHHKTENEFHRLYNMQIYHTAIVHRMPCLCSARTHERETERESNFIDLFITFFCTITIMLMVHMGACKSGKVVPPVIRMMKQTGKKTVDIILVFYMRS